MLTVQAKFDARHLLLKMERGQKRLAYAAANALNDVAKEGQAEVVKRVEGEYEVRKPSFITRQAAIIKPFASARQGRPYVEISIGKKPRLLLAVLEKGDLRKPFKGRRVAVPITGGAARPTFGSPVPQDWRLNKLRLRPAKVRVGPQRPSSVTMVGLQSTFVLDGPGVDQPGIYRRTGPTPSDIELVYAFEEPMVLKPTLRFVQTITLVSNKRLEGAFERHVKKELLR